MAEELRSPMRVFLASLAVVVVSVSHSVAQPAPGMFFVDQFHDISSSTCFARARAALATEKIPTINSASNHIFAGRSGSSVIILCRRIGGRTLATVVGSGSAARHFSQHVATGIRTGIFE
jgi:hypothetical protein